MEAKSIIVALPDTIDETYLQTHANIDQLPDQYQKTYQFIRRSAKPVGFVVHDQLILKLYHMERETEPLPQNLTETLDSFIYNEINQGRLEPKQGVGFAILSQGFLSINIWGRGNVLFTQTYTIEDSYPNLSAKPLAKTGVACTWEIRIMMHEYNLWHHYLETKMTSDDKKAYLQDFISGKLY